jgi:hypothetical protein
MMAKKINSKNMLNQNFQLVVNNVLWFIFIKYYNLNSKFRINVAITIVVRNRIKKLINFLGGDVR